MRSHRWGDDVVVRMPQRGSGGGARRGRHGRAQRTRGALKGNAACGMTMPPEWNAAALPLVPDRTEDSGLRDDDGRGHGFLQGSMDGDCRAGSRATALQSRGRRLRRASPRRESLPANGSAQTARSASRASSDRLTSIPQAKPPMAPPVRSTRWHGTNSAGALRAQMAAAARTAFGCPSAFANSA